MYSRLLSRICAAGLVALVATAAPASAFLQLSGSIQGLLRGDATQSGHQQWIEVQDFSHSITVPVDLNGIPTGAPETSPLTIGKLFDRASVPLFRAVTTNERMDQFQIDFMRPSQTGQQELYYVIRLYNARLLQLNQAGSGSSVPFESASFIYDVIELEDTINNTVVSYDWHSSTTPAPEPFAKGLLSPPAPNPTSGPAEFRFSLPVGSNAELTLYDLRGRLVRELHSGWTSAEPVVAVWDGTDTRGVRVAQGLYVAKLTYPGTVVTQRITVVR